MNVIYSYNKVGVEAEEWEAEILRASTERVRFVPFNHGRFLSPFRYVEAWQLDRLFRARDPGLMRLYEAYRALADLHGADALIVAHCPPYHPEFLREQPVYKVLYSSDDPDSTYRRNIPYLHAYDHVMFADPAHSVELDMREKMRYCGMVNADLVPIGVMDFEYMPGKSEAELFTQERDIDVLYVGSFFIQKLDVLAYVKRALGRRLRLHGFFRAKHNLYFNARYGVGHWVRPVSYEQRRALLQRARIGFNIHWNEYGLGNQRLYHLPANGVMQLTDCADHLHHFFSPGVEAAGYSGADDLIDRIRHYLQNHDDRVAIARAGHRRVIAEYRFVDIMHRIGRMIEEGMDRVGFQPGGARTTQVAVGGGSIARELP
jgi:hypothetical protein